MVKPVQVVIVLKLVQKVHQFFALVVVLIQSEIPIIVVVVAKNVLLINDVFKGSVFALQKQRNVMGIVLILFIILAIVGLVATPVKKVNCVLMVSVF